MRFSLDPDQVAFRDAVRSMLARECPPEVVRSAWEHDFPLDASLWQRLDDLGALSVLVDGGAIFAAVLCEEAGRCALPFPLMETAMVAAPYGVGPAMVATDIGGPVVAYGRDADLFLLHDEAGLHLVDPADVETQPVETVDRSRRAVRVTAWRRGDAVDGDVAAAFLRGALGSACVLIGLAERMLDMAVGYAKERQQFGVPIGSFQAVKHQLADALRDLAFARPAVRRAADSLDREVTSVGRDVSMAKALASDAAERAGRVALQVHGAIGYTVEYDLHLYLKRAWALSRSWGTPAQHRRRVADDIGLGSEEHGTG